MLLAEAARASRNTMSHVAVRRTDERIRALGETTAEIFGMDEPRRWLGGMMAGMEFVMTWADRVRVVHAECAHEWELPVIGVVCLNLARC